jgi:hypothetical protein
MSFEMSQQDYSSAPCGDDNTVSSSGLHTLPHVESGTAKHSSRWNIQRVRDSIGLNATVMLKMLKGGLPPTVVVAM